MAELNEDRLRQLVGEPPANAPDLWTSSPAGLQSRVRAMFPAWLGGKALAARKETKWSELSPVDKLRVMYQFRLDRIRANFIRKYVNDIVWPALNTDPMKELVERFESEAAAGRIPTTPAEITADKIAVITRLTGTFAPLRELRAALLNAGDFDSVKDVVRNYQPDTVPFAETDEGNQRFYQLISCFYGTKQIKDCSLTGINAWFAVYPRNTYNPTNPGDFAACFDGILKSLDPNSLAIPAPNHPELGRCEELQAKAAEQSGVPVAAPAPAPEEAGGGADAQGGGRRARNRRSRRKGRRGQSTRRR